MLEEIKDHIVAELESRHVSDERITPAEVDLMTQDIYNTVRNLISDSISTRLVDEADIRLSLEETKALANHWHLPLRVKAGNVEAKKGDSWGILCSLKEAKKNAMLLLSQQ